MNIGDMLASATRLRDALQAYGIEWRQPELLWGILAVPFILLVWAGTRLSRKRSADLFRIATQTPPRRSGRWRRGIASFLTLASLSGLAIAFARPVWTHPMPRDRATVIVILDVSEAMRATDVSPTRLQSARRIVQNAIDRAPERLQMGGVAYGPAAYVVANPTYDHGAVSAALQAVRSVTGAAPGDALTVALAAILASDAGSGKRVPGAIILVSTGDHTTGRPLGTAVAAIEEAGVPVHTVAIGPRGGAPTAAMTATPSPFNPDVLMQISRQTQGRTITNPTIRDWDALYQAIAEDVVMEPRPEEVGHLVGSAALATWTLGMVLLVTASRRLM